MVVFALACKSSGMDRRAVQDGVGRIDGSMASLMESLVKIPIPMFSSKRKPLLAPSPAATWRAVPTVSPRRCRPSPMSPKFLQRTSQTDYARCAAHVMRVSIDLAQFAACLRAPE